MTMMGQKTMIPMEFIKTLYIFGKHEVLTQKYQNLKIVEELQV